MSDKQTENGNLYFTDKDAAYLKKQSREAVETHHNSPILYFAVDWENSHRNFYGEMMMKKFVDNKGTEVKGTYKIEQVEETTLQGIPNQLMRITVSVFVEHLKELGIDPKFGDYFGIGKRLYQIYKRTLPDAGPGNLLMNRERMRQDFYAIQSDDERLQTDVWGDNLGLEYDIKQGNTKL